VSTPRNPRDLDNAMPRTAAQFTAQARAIIDRADEDGRDLSLSELNRVDDLLNEADRMERPGRHIRAEGFAPSRRGRLPASAGAFFVDVVAACNPSGGAKALEAQRRLMNAPTATASENVGADGGFAVPPEFRADIMTKVLGEDQLISLCDQVETVSNSLTVPKDETAPWSTAGIQAYWEAEGAQLQQKKPALQNDTIRCQKLTALVPVTNELIEDAPGLVSYLQRKAPEVMQFKVNDAIINGSGAGMPLGILNGGCLITVAKETSQPNATILAANVIKMYNGMLAEWRTDAVWLINSDAEQQLMQLTQPVKNVAGTENVGGWPIYVPPGGLSAQPFGTLLGKRVVPTQACQTLGTVGDIIFASMGQYAAVQRAGGIRVDSSIHVFFDYDTTCFRFIFRMGGQPWWSSTVAAKNGSGVYAPFVTLAQR
jgi:HK97 family phage major capsid protein